MFEVRKSKIEDNQQRIISLLNEHYEESFSTDEQLTAKTISISAFEQKCWIGGAVASLFGNTLHLSLLGVDPRYQQVGIGSQLLEGIQQTALENQCLYLTVNTQDYQAREFYEKFGFDVFSSVEDMPFVGTTKFYLKKQLGKT